ncbi:extracellular solute-binding protein [Vibrio sp. WXL103]|uniref:extracellular solute-binding protein n=1 Tax=Vibrio sp. WXL103 TaxID=3450710 RepID=UPI003EC5F382
MKTTIKKMLALAITAALSSSVLASQDNILKVALFPTMDKGVENAIDAFETMYPSYKVEFVKLSYVDHHNAMTTALATGANLPDVMAIEIEQIGRFNRSSGLVDLHQAPFNAAAELDKVTKYPIAHASNEKGQLSAFPVDIGPSSLFYRQDLFADAGIDIQAASSSWEAFIQSGVALKEKTGSYLVTDANVITQIFIRSDLKDGEGVYFNSDGQVMVNSERFKEAFRLSKMTRDLGLDARVARWSPEWSEGLRRGSIASELYGSWFGEQLSDRIAKDSRGQWRVHQLPGNSFANHGGSFLAITKQSKEQEAAWDFIKLVALNKDIQVTSLKKVNMFPVLIEAQGDSYLSQEVDFFDNQPVMKEWKFAAENLPVFPINRHDPTAQEYVNEALDLVLEGRLSIDDALADAERKIKRKARIR